MKLFLTPFKFLNNHVKTTNAKKGFKLSLRIAALVVLVSLFAVSSLAFTGCRRSGIVGKGFRFPMDFEPHQLDPQSTVNTSSREIMASLFEGLVKLDDEGKTVEGVASSWNVSSDGLVYTFNLRETWWSDYKISEDKKNKEVTGSKVTAHDFVFGFKRALSAQNDKSVAASLFNIKNAENIYNKKTDSSELGAVAENDTRLVITLEKRDDEFLYKLTTPPFMPCNEVFFEETTGRYGMDIDFVLSNGPFTLSAWNYDESILLAKHEGYYDAVNIFPDAVRYVIGRVEDPITTVADGVLDAAFISRDQKKSAEDKGLIISEQDDTVRYLLFNNADSLLTSSVARRSLRDAIEWELLYALFPEGVSDVASGFVGKNSLLSPDEVYRTEDNTLSVQRDLEQVKKAWNTLLKEKGVSMPSMKILCGEDDYSISIARMIAQSWQKNLSFYCEIESLSSTDLFNALEGDYDIAITELTPSGGYALDVFKDFVSTSSNNPSNFNNKSFDEAVSKMMNAEADRSEHEAAEQLLWQECPGVPLSFEKRLVALSGKTSGIIVRPFGGGIFGAQYDFKKAGKSD